jgi:hypothetical protein
MLRAIGSFAWPVAVLVLVLRMWRRIPALIDRLKVLPTPVGPVELAAAREETEEAMGNAAERIITAPSKVITIQPAIETDTAMPLTPRNKHVSDQAKGTDEARVEKKPLLDVEALRKRFAEVKVQQQKDTEGLIKAAALWGWTMREEGYANPPEPEIRWEGDRPTIVGPKTRGANRALMAALEKIRAEKDD